MGAPSGRLFRPKREDRARFRPRGYPPRADCGRQDDGGLSPRVAHPVHPSSRPRRTSSPRRASATACARWRRRCARGRGTSSPSPRRPSGGGTRCSPCWTASAPVGGSAPRRRTRTRTGRRTDPFAWAGRSFAAGGAQNLSKRIDKRAFVCYDNSKGANATTEKSTRALWPQRGGGRCKSLRGGAEGRSRAAARRGDLVGVDGVPPLSEGMAARRAAAQSAGHSRIRVVTRSLDRPERPIRRSGRFFFREGRGGARPARQKRRYRA